MRKHYASLYFINNYKNHGTQFILREMLKVREQKNKTQFFSLQMTKMDELKNLPR